MSSDEHSHLQDMSNLRFLVIDEADRLISKGNFPQLKQIFSYIQQKSPQPCDESDSDESEDDVDDDNCLKHLQGVRGEARVKMLNMNILKQIKQQRSDKPHHLSLMIEKKKMKMIVLMNVMICLSKIRVIR